MNNEKSIYCRSCKSYLPLDTQWKHHVRTEQHKKNAIEPVDGQIKKISDGFKGRILHYMYVNEGVALRLPEEFMLEAGTAFNPHLFNVLQSHVSAKVNFELFAEYVLLKEKSELLETKSFQSKMDVVSADSDLEQSFNEHARQIITKMEEFQEKDSGWTLIGIGRLEMNVNQYTPIRGSSFIVLPTKLSKKKAIINVQNNDNFCFKWTLISALMPQTKNPQGCSSYKVIITDTKMRVCNDVTLDFTGLSFPLKIKEIKIFTKNNPQVSINVFGYDEESGNIIGPLFHSGYEQRMHVNMLFLEDGEYGHFMWIKNISRLVFYFI